MKNSGQQTHIIKHSASRFYNLLLLFTQKRIEVRKYYTNQYVWINIIQLEWWGSPGEPIIQGAGL